MITLCAWCGKQKSDDGDAATVLEVSHGICLACVAKLEDEQRAKGERLNAHAALYSATGKSVLAYDDPQADCEPMTADQRRRVDNWFKRTFRKRADRSMPACQIRGGL